MKRFLTLVLALFIIITTAATVCAAEEYGKENTFFMANYLYNGSGGTATDYGYDNDVPMVWVRIDDINSKGTAFAAKEITENLKKQPKGRRVLMMQTCTDMLYKYSVQEDPVFSKIGEEKLGPMMDSLFKALKENGAEIDFVVDDNEGGRSVYAFENEAILHFMKEGENTAATIEKNGHLYEDYIKKELVKLENSDVYKTIIRPKLEEKGFVFGEEYDLYYLNVFPGAQEPRRSKFYANEQPEGAATANNIYSGVMGELSNDAYNKYVTANILKYYPNVYITNYDSKCYMDGEYELPDSNGNKRNFNHKNGSGNGIKGNATSYVNYGEFGNIETRPPDGYPYDKMAATGFNVLLYAQTIMEHQVMWEEKYGNAQMPWVWTKNSGPFNLYKNYYKTNYYDESIFHTLLKNPVMLQVYDDDFGSGAIEGDMKYLSDLLHEMDKLCGFDDRKAIAPTLQNMTKWDQRYILSGMYAGGKNVWRITPDLYTPGVSIENFCVNKNKPTFQIGNQFVEFPDGSYIYEKEGALSNYGYWVISPEGTKPRQYRDESKPEPDMAVATADYIPTGANLPVTGNGKKSTLIDRNYDESVNNQETANDNQQSAEISVKPIDLLSKFSNVVTEKLPDDVVGHWAESTLKNMFEIGVLKGTGSGIEPNRNVNKAEFITMLFRLFDVKEKKYDGSINDVSENAWYADTIYTAVKGGLISAEGGKATPEAPLSRGETMVIFVKLINSILPETDDSGVTFADEAEFTPETLEAVKKCVALGIVNGYPDGTFKPENILTRAEVATIIERYLRL